MQYPCKRSVSTSQIWIFFFGFFCIRFRLGHGIIRTRKIIRWHKPISIRQARIRISIIGVEFDGFFEMLDGFVESLLAAFVPFAATGLIFGLSLGVLGGFLGELLSLGSIQPTLEFAG